MSGLPQGGISGSGSSSHSFAEARNRARCSSSFKDSGISPAVCKVSLGDRIATILRARSKPSMAFAWSRAEVRSSHASRNLNAGSARRGGSRQVASCPVDGAVIGVAEGSSPATNGSTSQAFAASSDSSSLATTTEKGSERSNGSVLGVKMSSRAGAAASRTGPEPKPGARCVAPNGLSGPPTSAGRTAGCRRSCNTASPRAYRCGTAR